MARPLLAAVILTRDEQRDLPGCLASLKGVADEIYVIDSGSRDATVSVAEDAGAVVLTNEFHYQAQQFNWALDHIGTRAEWLLRIDADERVSKELGHWLRSRLGELQEEVAGIEVARRIVFMGQELRHGGTFPVWLLRVWRQGRGFCEDRKMDEHMLVDSGHVLRAGGELLHLIPKSLAEWSHKHVGYAEREVEEILGAGRDAEPAKRNARKEATGRRYYRLPPLLRAVGYWGYRYFLRLGFLDGRIGFLYHFLQGFWYRTLVDGLMEELSRPGAATDVEAKRMRMRAGGGEIS